MIEFKNELLEEVREEIEPLLYQHYLEVAMYQDKIKLNPMWDSYESMEELNLLKIYTMRDEGKLVGYGVYFVTPSMHYSDHEYALNDIVFIDPDYRRSEQTPEFFIYCEQQIRELGVSVITYHMKTHKPFRTLMELLGYDHAEELYMKYIGS